jgi:hypothetical protein
MASKPSATSSAPLPAVPASQSCAKCGAVFRWAPSDPKVKGAPLVAHLVKAADTCDCGYGTGRPVFDD